MLSLVKRSLKKNADEFCDASSSMAPQYHRLKPPNADHCVLCFKMYLHDLTFEGSEIVKMKLSDHTKEITVNAVDLVITKAIWEEDVTMNRQEPSGIVVADGKIRLVFEPSLLQQTGSLRLNFRGNMSDKRLSGFYLYNTLPAVPEDLSDSSGAPYKQPTKECLNVLTEFDPCEARRCFPCWDDPAIKMKFDVILVVPKNSVVVGPTLVKATYAHKRDPMLEVVEFKTTPKLSTHAIGFTFGTFDFIEGRTTDSEMTVRVYTPPGKKKDAEFALLLTCQALPFFGAYFGVPLPSQKVDLVAVPDHISSPIECWGLIFYRSADILVEPETAALDLMWVSLIICHELTKQWFGNLVTFEWWSHQWLKEGFAAFAKYIFVHKMFPEMDVWSHFVTHMLQKALRVDGLRSAHPLEYVVISTVEIEEAVDDICEEKAPSLLRMVHRFVGDEAFRNGLELYLIKYGYGNATSTDFWKCLQEASSKPVASMMANWSTTKGYPLITVTAKHVTKTRILKLSQDRFLYDQVQRDAKAKSQIWSIPITFSTRHFPTSSVHDIVMDGKSTTVMIPDVGKTDWVKVNPGAVGYYRVRYPHDMFSQLVYGVREKSLPPLDRVNILDDAFAFLLAGITVTTELLSLLEAYIEEDDYAVWVTVSYIFDKCLNVFDHVGRAESFQSFGRYIYQTIYFKLGWEEGKEESVQKKFLRGLVLRMMVKFNHPEVVEQCKIMFEAQFGDEPEPVPVDLRYIVYKSVVAHGDDTMHKRIIRMFRESDSAEERDKLAYAIGASRNPVHIQYALEFSLSDEVRRAHTIFVFSSAVKTKVGKELAWTFFKENFHIFEMRYGPHQISKLLQIMLEDFTSEEKVTDILNFFKSNPFPGTEWIIQQIAESIRLNEQWLRREKNLTALQDYLESM